MHSLDIAEVFSKHPAGRYAEDGPYSGEKFREEILIPALAEYGEISIELDNTAGYGSSFLEEAFGGLIRAHVASATDLRDRISLVTDDEALSEEIWEYVDQAEYNNVPQVG